MTGSYNRHVETAAIVQGILARLTPALAAPFGTYLPLSVGHRTVGWIDAARCAAWAFECLKPRRRSRSWRLADWRHVSRTRPRVARTLAAEALSAWRDEPRVGCRIFDAPPLFSSSGRCAAFSALPPLPRTSTGWSARWRARCGSRGARKGDRPGIADNLVGGGSLRATVPMTVVKAWEEAGIPGAIAARAECRFDLRAQPKGSSARRFSFSICGWTPNSSRRPGWRSGRAPAGDAGHRRDDRQRIRDGRCQAATCRPRSGSADSPRR